MDPTDRLRHELEQMIERSKSHEKQARRGNDPGLMIIHRARAAAFKEALAVLDKLTINQP